VALENLSWLEGILHYLDGGAYGQLILVFVGLVALAVLYWRARMLTRRRLVTVADDITKEQLQAKLDSQIFVLKGYEFRMNNLQKKMLEIENNMPSEKLAEHDKEIVISPHKNTLNMLTAIYDMLWGTFSRCAGLLAEYELGLVVDGNDSRRLDRVQRLARVACAIAPSQRRYGELLAEIEARVARVHHPSTTTDVGFEAADLGTLYFGPEDQEQAEALVNSLLQWGLTAHREGWKHSAVALCRRAAMVARRRFGADDPRAMRCDGQLALAMSNIGEHREASSQLQDLLDRHLKTLGRTHVDTMRVRQQLVTALGNQQQHAEAEKLLHGLLDDQIEVYGADHPEVLTTRHILAAAVYHQGRIPEAEALWREVVGARERLLGSDHPDTLRTRANLATILAVQGRYGEAQALWAAVISAQERILGREHPETLATRFTQAQALAQQERSAEAEAALTDLLALRRRTLGTGHPQTIETERALAALISPRSHVTPRNLNASVGNAREEQS
jgi:tetratricopeptide (TPR) repeat protein